MKSAPRPLPPASRSWLAGPRPVAVLLLALLGAHPASPATAQPASPADELASLGWQRVAEPLPECVLIQPVLEPVETVWMAMNRPVLLPRPDFACGDSQLQLPVAQDVALMERVEGPPASVVWAVRAEGRVRGTAAAVNLDFPPHAPVRPQPVPNTLGELPSELGEAMVIPPRPVRDPALRGRASKFNRIPEPPEPPQPPALQVQVMTEALREDGLFATADGTRWVRLSLAPERAVARHAINPERIFGGKERILVAPRALQFDAATVLLAVDPATGETTSLGRPAPPDAGHWLRITDVRDSGALIEALVVVDEISPQGLTSPWGFLARREGDAWSFPERYFTPSDKGVLPELRFDPSDASLVRLESGSLRATRTMSSAAGAAAVP